jgi:hypothetical protein
MNKEAATSEAAVNELADNETVMKKTIYKGYALYSFSLQWTNDLFLKCQVGV